MKSIKIEDEHTILYLMRITNQQIPRLLMMTIHQHIVHLQRPREPINKVKQPNKMNTSQDMGELFEGLVGMVDQFNCHLLKNDLEGQKEEHVTILLICICDTRSQDIFSFILL